jgi:hypothetical protein
MIKMKRVLVVIAGIIIGMIVMFVMSEARF